MKVRELYAVQSFVVTSLPPQDQDVAPIEPPKSGNYTYQTIHAEADSEPTTSQVNEIVVAWQQVLGVALNQDTVKNHLETLKRWHDRLNTRHGGLFKNSQP